MSYDTQGIELNEALAKLPADVQQAIGEIDVVSEIWKIGQQFELLIIEIGDICEETKKVIAGETRPESFIDNIRSKLDDERKNKANEIGSEINNRILTPIRNAYKRASMGNLVPDPNESVLKQIPSDVTSQTFDEQRLGGQAISSDTASYSDRDFLMHEIEKPTPAGVSTMSLNGSLSSVKAKPPVNLPTEEAPEREIPVIRTMPNDLKSFNNSSMDSGLPQ